MMPKYVKLIVGCFLFLFLSNVIFAAEPPNLTLFKHTLSAYHDSGVYERDIINVIADGEKKLKTKIAENKASGNKVKLALVFDVDETSVSSYDYMSKTDFSSAKDVLSAKLNMTNFPAIPESLALYNFAKQNGVAVFFITARKDVMRANTVKELTYAGYKNWDHLYMRPDNNFLQPAAAFKASVRKQLETNSYEIVLDVGDQYSDLIGGYADYTVKLPNPYYFVP